MERDRRRREYVPASAQETQHPVSVGGPGEDVQLALDTLERRIAHLSALLNPAPGTRPHRTAHWRDEVELKSLRLSVKALRAYQQADLAVGMLSTTVETLQQVLDSGALPVRQQEDLRRLLRQVDDVLEVMT